LDFEEFKKTHPYPDEDNHESLFRFMRVDRKNINFLEELFIHQKLFHNLASSFNDPFEGKPHFTFDTSENNIEDVNLRLIKVAQQKGYSTDDIIKMLDYDEVSMSQKMNNAIESYYEHVRFCCFTTNKENLLFWSHYADSHKGFCVEFDASKLPISLARKVQYSNEYPQLIYPVPQDERVLRPSLVKSPDWKYENEFRTCLSPHSKIIPHDGQSLYLHESLITNVYLGCKMESEDKQTLLKIIYESRFNPKIWQAELAKNSFGLMFKKT